MKTNYESITSLLNQLYDRKCILGYKIEELDDGHVNFYAYLPKISQKFSDSQPILTHTFLKTPKYVGGYIIGDGNFKINLTKKPNWFNILMVKLFLGWKWEKENE